MADRHPNHPVCCVKCGEPVKIVCDAHGTDCVLDLSATVAATPDTTERRAPKPEPRHARGTTLFAILDAISADALHPSTPASIAKAVGLSPQNVSVRIPELISAGAVQRVGRGLYVRPRFDGEVPHG